MNNHEIINEICYPTKLSNAQNLAVRENGEIIVSAAAGSGKTSTMVKHILRLIFDGVSLKDMLILVYNNAAADELKEKLHDALFDTACKLEGDMQGFVKKQLDELSFAHISTIHAYCQSLIKENFNFLGISPTFEVLDEDAHAEYMDEALDNVFDAYDKEGDEMFGKIVEVFSMRRKEENLKDNVKKLFRVIDIQPDKDVFFNNVRACYKDFANSKFIEIILCFEHDYFKKVRDMLSPCVEVLKKGAEENPKEFSKYCERVVNAYYTANRIAMSNDFEEICNIANEFEDLAASKQAKWDAIYFEAASVTKACIDDMKKELSKLAAFAGKTKELKIAHAQNKALIEKLVEIAVRFGAELVRLKEEDNVLAFEDLEHKAVELLSLEAVNIQKFKHVFVDEYQDVNPTEEYIISKLIDENCFMVGDTKQSIYAFRLADPTNFANRQTRYENGEGKAIYFNRNFRSAKQILEAVNGVFDIAMTLDTADVDYKHTARFELDNAKDGGNVELHLFYFEPTQQEVVCGVYDITSDEGADDELTSGDCEGIFIAKKIEELVGRKLKDDGKYLGYGDVSIITRNRSANARRIVAQLKNAGIPVDDSGFEKAKSEPERELIEMLKAIDNPRQDIYFVGFLLSYFGGYNEQELARIAAVPAGTFYDKFLIYALKDDALATKIRETKNMLDRYRVKASFKNVKDLAGGIIADFSYDAYLGKNGEADVYGLKAFVSGISDKDNESLGKFLKNYGANTAKKSVSAKCDRVHISTFHGYKGLENEVVFVSDLDAGFSINDVKGDLIVDGKGYIALNYFDFDNNEKSDCTISRFATRKLYDKKTLGEEMRLLYVAMTRAKSEMYLTSSISKKGLESFGKLPLVSAPASMLDIIGEAIYEGFDIKCFEHKKDEFDSVGTKKQSYVFPPSDRVLQQKIEDAQAFVYPFKNATELAIKYSVSALDSLDEQTVSAYAEGGFKDVGTIYHKVMQYIDFAASGVDEVKKEIARLVNEKLLTEDELDKVRKVDGENFEKKIATCLASDIIALARECEKKGGCMKEKSFMMYKPAHEVSDEFDVEEKVLVQGVIDLFIDGDKKIIVDFKNSSLKDEKTIEKYKKQLNLYKMAVESAIRAKVDKIVLYSFKTGKTIEV